MKISAYLLKKKATFERPIKDIALGLNEIEFIIRENDLESYRAKLFTKETSRKPDWIDLFNNIKDVNLPDFKSKNLQGLFLIEYKDKLICFTFGHSRHLLKKSLIEKNFGLKIALNLSEPDKIKSIDKTKIDKNPIKSRHQSSQNISINNFDFNFDWEILKSVTGITVNKSDESQEIVTGSDSVNISTNIESIEDFIFLSERLIESYSLEDYKKIYPWIDYIVPIIDSELIDNLDMKIEEKLYLNDLDSLWLSSPEIIDYENFSGFTYKKGAKQIRRFDLDLINCLKDKKKDLNDVTVSYLQRTNIYVLDANEGEIDAWSVYDALNVEMELDECLYILNEGDWYEIDKGYSSDVNSFFDKFKNSCDISLPNYSGKTEPKYLMDITKVDDNLILMDRKNIKPHNASSPIEFADLIKKDDNRIIHVKKYSSSSVLSHLFSQAYVSSDVLLNYPETINQVNEKINDSNYKFEFDIKEIPRNIITLGIMQASSGELKLPFFSKVNFRQYCRNMINTGFRVELLKIPN